MFFKCRETIMAKTGKTGESNWINSAHQNDYKAHTAKYHELVIKTARRSNCAVSQCTRQLC